MTGATMEVTLPIRLIPPMMTMPTMVAVMRPVIIGAMPNELCTCVAMVLACTALPVMNEVTMSAKAKNIATGFQFFPSPRSM